MSYDHASLPARQVLGPEGRENSIGGRDYLPHRLYRSDSTLPGEPSQRLSAT